MSDEDDKPEDMTRYALADLLTLANGNTDKHWTWCAIGELQKRGTQLEWDAASALTHSADAEKRAAGAAILGQLGYTTGNFRDEAVETLITLLRDTNLQVVIAAALALGHRHAVRAIPALIALAAHPDNDVRGGVVHGLLSINDRRATDALVELSRDDNPHNRDWATFGLGQLTDLDYPELRNALAARLDDDHEETRQEGLCGLVARKDPRGIAALKEVLDGKSYTIGGCHLDAAAALADPAMLLPLQVLRIKVKDGDDSYWVACLDSAICACTPREVLG